jgi:hypothetical protein
MNTSRRLSILFTGLLAVTVISMLPGAALAAGPGISSNTTVAPLSAAPQRNIDTSGVPNDCSLIGFEGIGNNNPVGTYFGPVTVQFGSSWLGLVDADAGGSGNFANEPSPSTAAYFLDQNDISITLTPPVRFVQFQYTAAAQSLPITVYAYDSANNLISSASGNVIGTSYDGANCTGDPNGSFCLWDQISLVSGTDNIASVKITGAISNFFGIDNLYFCTSTTPAHGTTWGQLKSTYR